LNRFHAYNFFAGFGIAAWAPLVPFAKVRVRIDEGVLGHASAMPWYWLDRVGTGIVRALAGWTRRFENRGPQS
jgi:hypothetical protein